MTMETNEINTLMENVRAALQGAANAENTANFLHRVLVQAVLTHGGELPVDPSLADQAKADTRRLEFGGGGVRLV